MAIVSLHQARRHGESVRGFGKQSEMKAGQAHPRSRQGRPCRAPPYHSYNSRSKKNSSMLNRIQAQLANLTKAERRVGEWILANAVAVLNQDTRSMALQMNVSQPTLVRFSRSLGYAGFQEFRMQLAKSLGAERANANPMTMLSITSSPDVKSLASNLFAFTSAAILQASDDIDAIKVAKAIALLDKAGRVEFFGFGNSISVAQDAVRRFMRLETQASASVDPAMQSLAARQLRKGDVLVLISQVGHSVELAQLLATAHAAGAATIALSARNSPLFQKASIGLAIDLADSGTGIMPGTAQILQSLMVDLLALGVASRRGGRIAATVAITPKSRPAKTAARARPA
jgi:DNA-binding MurR/RpiR family transcriptional regulator